MALPDLDSSTLDPQLVEVLKQMSSDITILQESVAMSSEYPTREEIDKNSGGLKVFNVIWKNVFPEYTQFATTDGVILQIGGLQENLQIAADPISGTKLMFRINDTMNSEANAEYAGQWGPWYVIPGTRLT